MISRANSAHSLLATSALLTAFAAAQPALAQNACTAAGIEPGCCEQVCAINPLCCDVAWDAKCESILLSIGCICAGATPITGDSTAIDTTGATRDLDLTGFCDPGPFGDDTIYNFNVYAWTPATTGRYTLSTCNIANFDTRIAVLSGCAAGTVVACNDDGDGCSAFTSILAADVVGGTRYYIVLGGYSEADVGTGTLSITEFQVQLTLEGAHRFEQAAGGNGNWYAKYAVGPGATWEDIKAKVEAQGGSLACANSVGESHMLGSIYRATGSGANTAFGLYQDLADPNYSEPLGGWKWTDGTAFAFTNWAANEPNDAGGTEHYGQFVAYYFGEFWNDVPASTPWSHVLVEYGPKGVPEAPTPPANDEAFGAIALQLNQLNTVSLVGATTSAAPLGCEDPLFYDRWYSFTPPATDSYDFVACGNGFTGAAAVYAAGGSLVACSGGQCTLTASLTAGQSYLVRIGSPDGDSAGNPTLVVYPTPEIVSLDAVSVNFVGGTFLDGGDGGRCSETATFPAGANAWGTLNWANIVGQSDAAAAGYSSAGNGDAPTALRDGFGTATTASLQYSVNNTWRIFSFPANDTDWMRRGYLDTNGLPEAAVTVSNVPYATYAVVVYFGADGPDRNGSVIVNGGAPIYFKTDAVPAGVFNPLVEATATAATSAVRASYAVFRGQTLPTCTMQLVETGPNLGFMGFQIIKEEPACASDLDGDGNVSAADLATLLSAWGTPAGDTNGDGTTDAQDIATLLGAWGSCP